MATVDEVRDALGEAGVDIAEERRLGNDTGTQFRLADVDAVVNVFVTGRCNVQGRAKAEIEPILERLGTGAPRRQRATTKVFVAYGHDDDARTQLEAMLRRWGLDPLILDQLPSEGQTVIEKLFRYLTDEDVGFAVVLATPDDEGHRAGHEEEKASRARQNVVLELGMLLAHLGRPRVAILLKDAANMERPSDIQGLIYLPFTEDVAEQKLVLAQEMNKQGYHIPLDRI